MTCPRRLHQDPRFLVYPLKQIKKAMKSSSFFLISTKTSRTGAAEIQEAGSSGTWAKPYKKDVMNHHQIFSTN